MILSVTKTNTQNGVAIESIDPSIDCFNESDSERSANIESAEGYLCSVRQAARIVGQKWTLQIVNVLMDFTELRFCELQQRLGNVNPSTLSARLKMLEEEGILMRSAVSAAPPYVTYRLTEMGDQLSGVIHELTEWSRRWLCDDPASSSAILEAVE